MTPTSCVRMHATRLFSTAQALVLVESTVSTDAQLVPVLIAGVARNVEHFEK